MFFEKRKWLLVFLIPSLLFFIFSFPIFAQDNIGLSAEGAILMDVQSGRVLYEKNINKKMRIASLTKIMSAIVAIENGNLNDIVTTSDLAYGTEGSSIYLKSGEKLSLEDMLYGLMLRSGNDAAVAIAEHIGGSIEGFAYLMNEKAAYLGMSHSYFVNPHGLDHKNHYSTPKDMAILTAHALQNPTFQQIVSTKTKTAPLEGEAWDRKWLNKNKLLSMYQWADGVKTGYTKLSRRCLSSSATKNEMQLTVITLNAPDDWNDHIKLFEYGFEHYQPTIIAKKNQVLEQVKIKKGDENVSLIASQDLIYPLTNEEKEKITKKMIWTNNVEIKPNHVVGIMQYYLNDQYIGSVSLKILDKTTWSQNIMHVWKGFWGGE